MRWIPSYFYFTESAFEVEIFYREEWVELLGCGVIHHDILKNSKRDPS